MSAVNVEFYKSQLFKHADQLDQKLLTNDYVKLINEKTQVRPSFLAVGISTFLFVFLIWAIGAQFVANFIGFAYPLYESFRSLTSAPHTTSSTTSTHSQQQWLTYWIIYATFTLLESLTDFFLYWIPLYHLVKISFLVWCMLPQTRGAEVIYVKVIEPVLIRYEGKIDSVGREGKRAAKNLINEVANEAASVEGQINTSTASTTSSIQGEK